MAVSEEREGAGAGSGERRGTPRRPACGRLEGVSYNVDQRSKTSVLRGHPPLPNVSTGTAAVCCGVTPSTSWGGQEPAFTGSQRLQRLGNWEQPELPWREPAGQWAASGRAARGAPRAPSPRELWFCVRCGLGVSGSCPGLTGRGTQASGGGAVQGPALLGAFSPEGPVLPGERVGKAPRAVLLEDGSIQPHPGLQRNCSSV